MKQKVKVSLIQAAPVLFDLKGTLSKIEAYLKKVSKERPDLVLFPEAFIPAYPRGLSFGTVVGSRSEEGRSTWLKYWENCIKVPGKESEHLGSLAKKFNCFISIGVVERGKTGTLYCTMLLYDRKGNLVLKHRKLKPTAAERIIWGEGDGKDLNVVDSEIGKLGGLICWENYMPLARTALYKQGVEIYLAPTADHRESWQSTMKHIATEGRCFVLGCNQFVKKDDYPELEGENVSDFPEIMSKGGSIIIDPLGNTVIGPLFDEVGVLTAELDMSLIAKGKMDFDPVGHYARDDIFELKWNK
ncbi:MAG: carbon-nitrogen hydrolase family protein [Bacteroidota bacterium]